MPRREIKIEKVYQAVIDKEIEIDENGKIWRVAKRGWDQWKKRTVTRPCKRVRAEHGITTGYLQIRVMVDSVRYNTGAHRLVYYHFKGEIPTGMTVNHKDGVKWNNHPDNLELATNREQLLHATRVLKVGHAVNQNGEKNSMSVLKEGDIIEIRAKRANGMKLEEIAKDYNVRMQQISRIVRGERWAHIKGNE